MKRFLFVSLCLACLFVQAAPFDTVYNNRVFDRRIVNFSEAEHPGSICQEPDGTLVIGNGRIVLRKVCLPKTRRDARLTVRVSLRSHGDRWDKAGSVFLIPCRQPVNMISVAQGAAPYPDLSVCGEKFPGIISSLPHYAPSVELLRFMTPFGVGHYTPRDSISRERIQPAWLDEYADSVEWLQDATDRLPILQDSCWVGLAIDTWTAEGYQASVQLILEESRLKGDKAPVCHVVPLVNTLAYYQQEYCDLFARQPLTTTVALPRKARNAMLYYVVSGHGGHSGGDEFTPCENILSFDGREVCRFTPWRTDCYTFRRFNPSTGVWLREREASYITNQGTRGQRRIEETIASSDLSRSGWCPGSDVPPMRIPLGALDAGEHTLTISIPEAQPADGDKLNHWLVSSWLTWEE
ncbi:MAG: N-glycanase [Bacteroidaceae bacterium]|nr:N-glycanase [Bacteroidaceae bacterium]